MRTLSICILGGTGFVGSHLVSRLIQDGHDVTVLSRDREAHKHLSVVPGLNLVNCDVYNVNALSERFRGQDVVINLVGILNERWFGGGGFRRVQVDLVRCIVHSCRSAGVTRLLQMSALNAAVDAPSYYLRSKGEAEQFIRQNCGSVDWTIFKPSVIFGPHDSFLNRFAALLRMAPLVFPLAKPGARFSPVYVGDVTAAMARALWGGGTSRQSYELGGPQQFTLKEIVELTARLTGLRRWIVGLPDPVSWLQALILGFVPGKPFSLDNYRSLSVDSVCSESGLTALGVTAQAMPGVAKMYLGAFEDNARLSACRAQVGRDA
jgi:uncharacterized protein YbjT (DUF2867 family)